MAARKLKTPPRDTQNTMFCGAYCLMAITGKTHEQACRTIRRANGWPQSRPIKGLWNVELVKAFKYTGERLTLHHRFLGKIKHEKLAQGDGEAPTLAKWLRDRRGEDLHQTYLIVLSTHFVIVSGNQFIDTYTREPVKVDDAPHRRALVQEVWRIGGERRYPLKK